MSKREVRCEQVSGSVDLSSTATLRGWLADKSRTSTTESQHEHSTAGSSADLKTSTHSRWRKEGFYHGASSCTRPSAHALSSCPARQGSLGKCMTAPVIGSVCVVVTLSSVKLPSVPTVPRVPVDVTVPVTVAGSERIAIGKGASAGYAGGSPNASSPCKCAGGGGELGKPRPGNTAESGGEATSPTSARWRRRSSSEIEMEWTREPPLLPVGPRECDDAEGREEFEPVMVWRDDAGAEPVGLMDE